MARMMGSVPANKWEREVYSQLKLQLPSEWIVIAGVTWSRIRPSSNSSFVRDGEADFVVLVPSAGLIVLEVKGSRRFRIDADGRWYRAENETGPETAIDKPPPVQAMQNMHDLVSFVTQLTGWPTFPGAFAYLVIYPQGLLTTPAPPLFDKSTLVTQPFMNQLEGMIRRSLSARALPSNSFTGPTVDRVAEILTNRPFVIVKADTTLELRDDLQGIETLTKQQFAALQGVFRFPKVAVVGPAGAGKTVLGLWRVKALAEQGMNCLYVCYNKNLAEALRIQNPEIADQVQSVDQYFRHIADVAAHEVIRQLRPQEEAQYFAEALPNAVTAIAADWQAARKLDALVVDEGQDFNESRIIALLELLKPDGTYMFLADWRQDLFDRSASSAIGAEIVFSLHHNCRNTVRTNARTNKLVNGTVQSMPGVPDGVEPLVHFCADVRAMAAKAWQIAQEWRASGPVAILSPWVLERSCMSDSRSAFGLQLSTDVKRLGEKGTIHFSTIKGFKGLEAASVIVVDSDLPDRTAGLREEDLYVACTRPTGRLALLTRSKDAAQWMNTKVSAPA